MQNSLPLPWDETFMDIARAIARRSKDTRTQVGAVVVRDNRVLSLGFNGLPRDVLDLPERLEAPEKYHWMVHAEINACIQAKGNLAEARVYSTLPCCTPCTLLLLQFGIREIVIAEAGMAYLERRHWQDGDWYSPKNRAVAAAAREESGCTYRILPNSSV